jgi:uncharacterized protein (DUF779 family)
MRSLLFILSLCLYTQASHATVVNLKSIFNSKTTGTVTITEDKNTEVSYELNVEDKDQAYAILMYKAGNCTDFSSPMAVTVNDPKSIDKNIALNSLGNQFLIFQSPSKQLKLTGKLAAPVGSFFSFEPKGKVLVLMAIKDHKSDSGRAVACGVHP